MTTEYHGFFDQAMASQELEDRSSIQTFMPVMEDPDSPGVEAEITESEDESGVEPEIVGVPTGVHNGCADCSQKDLVNQLHSTQMAVEDLAAEIKEMGGYITALARQQQVLTEHQKQVAAQQNWMAEQVKNFVDTVPQMMAGLPGIGKMMSKRMGGLTNGE